MQRVLALEELARAEEAARQRGDEQNALALRRMIRDSSEGQGDPDEIIRGLRTLKHTSQDVAAHEVATFMTRISAAAVVNDEPGDINLPTGYYADLVSIRGTFENPATDPELLQLITFNLNADGKRGDIFTSPIEMGFLHGGGAGGAPVEMAFNRGRHRFEPGAALRARFALHSTYATNASEEKWWGVACTFALYNI